MTKKKKQRNMTKTNKVSTKKKIRDYLGIFPNMGRGLPKTKNKNKKVPLNHPKKTKIFTKSPIVFILNKGLPKGGGAQWAKIASKEKYLFLV